MTTFSKASRTALAAAGLALTVGLTGEAALAAGFPSGPVELVVPWNTGGGTDASARIFAPFLSAELGVPVKVINIEGGGGWVAWNQMTNWDAKRDDHKIGIVNLPHVFAYLDPKMGLKKSVADFNFLSGQSIDPCMWLVREGDERFQTGKDFIEYAKKNPNQIIVSSTAVGSDDYQGLAYAEKFIPGFQVSKVYANNDAKKVQELLGKHTDAIAGNVSFYVPYILDGSMKPLMVLGAERNRFVPSVPTFKEVTGVENICFAGRTLAVAPGLPAEKFKVYLDAVTRAQDKADYVMKEINNSSTVWPVSGKELTEFIKKTEEQVKATEYWAKK